MKPNELHVIYGSDAKSMAKKLMAAVRAEEEIPGKNALIGLKPNLVVAKPASSGATTSPEMVAGVIEYLQERGFFNIIILEGSWVGDATAQAFRTCGYTELSRRYGVPLHDCQQESYSLYDAGDGMMMEVADLAMRVQYLINMPVLKGHCQTAMTCALKNMKGIISNREKRRFHTMGLHKPIAHLGTVRKGELILVDGLCGDLDFEEGGNPVPMNRMIAGRDPVLTDAFAASLMGFSVGEVAYIGMAERIGVGSADLGSARITELNQPAEQKRPQPSRRAKALSRYIQEDMACSACYGSLIHALARLDERGELKRITAPIHIGQGCKGKRLDGVGIGTCTAGMRASCGGCPPSGEAIMAFLRGL